MLSFLFIIIRSGRLAEIKWSVHISKSLRSLCVSLSRVVHIPSVRMVKFKLLAQFQWKTLPPPQTCLVLYYFCASLLHSFIMWLIVSSLSLHNEIFVAASHKTGLDTRSKARRPIRVGIKGWGRSGTSRDSNPAKCNVGPMSQAVSRT